MSPDYYHSPDTPRPLDWDSAKAALMQYIRNNGTEGCTVADLLQEFPSATRDQLKSLLKELKAEGEAHSVGRTKGGRWYSGKATK